MVMVLTGYVCVRVTLPNKRGGEKNWSDKSVFFIGVEVLGIRVLDKRLDNFITG